MKRINWAFLAIIILAALAILARAVLTEYYPTPRLIRHHLADFGFPAVFTTIFSGLIAILTSVEFRLQHTLGLVRAHLTVAVLGMLVGLNIEREDYYGEAEDGFDPGAIVTNLLGAPDTDTFDWWDIVAISLGGLLVIYLQWRSTKHIRLWQRLPLFVDGRA